MKEQSPKTNMFKMLKEMHNPNIDVSIDPNNPDAKRKYEWDNVSKRDVILIKVISSIPSLAGLAMSEMMWEKSPLPLAVIGGIIFTSGFTAVGLQFYTKVKQGHRNSYEWDALFKDPQSSNPTASKI